MIWPLLRVVLGLAMLLSGWGVFRHWRALEIFVTEPGFQGVQEALRWNPEDSDFYFRQGLLQRDQIEHRDLGASIASLQRAVSLNPYNWRFWMELGRTHEIAGQSEPAERAYRRALELNPRSAPYAWRLGNFYLRQGRLHQTREFFRQAVASDPSYAPGALELLWRLGLSPEEIASTWPPDKVSRLTLIQFLTSRSEGQEEMERFIYREWRTLLHSSGVLISEGDFYFQHLLRQGRYPQARVGWVEWMEKNGIYDAEFRDRLNYVWQGGFEAPFSGASLDWNLIPTNAMRAAYHRRSFEIGIADGPDGSRCLRLHFHGSENLSFRGVEQEVIADPGERYTFSFRARSQSLTTEEGLFFEIADASSGAQLYQSESIRETTPWTRYSGSFQLPRGCNLLRISLRRKESRRIDSALKGVVWLDAIRIEKESRLS